MCSASHEGLAVLSILITPRPVSIDLVLAQTPIGDPDDDDWEDEEDEEEGEEDDEDDPMQLVGCRSLDSSA